MLQTIKLIQKLKLTYEHVAAHQDKTKTWWQLTLKEQLICVCNGLAKAAVYRSLMDETPCSNSYLLPLEKAAVIVKGEKSTTDIAKEVKFCLGENEARRVYTDEQKKTGGGMSWSQH